MPRPETLRFRASKRDDPGCVISPCTHAGHGMKRFLHNTKSGNSSSAWLFVGSTPSWARDVHTHHPEAEDGGAVADGDPDRRPEPRADRVATPIVEELVHGHESCACAVFLMRTHARDRRHGVGRSSAGPQPIFEATETIADHSEWCSARHSCTSRTARSRTSAETPSLPMAPPAHMEPLENPGRFSQPCHRALGDP